MTADKPNGQDEWRVGLIDLGCAKNTVDSESVLGILLENGFSFAASPAEADLLLVNTCGFIQEAKEESIEHLLEAVGLKEEFPSLKVAAIGCLAQRYGRELAEDIGELDGVLGLGAYRNILACCRAICRGERVVEAGEAPTDLPGEGGRLLLTGSAFAYLKIAEGCDNRCSYCAVPLIRGGFRSRPPARVLAEAATLVENGARELCLVAQDPGAYGSDLEEDISLASLLRQILAETGDAWVRLLYMHPANLDREVIGLLGSEERLLGYLDMPVQHIATPVLERMGRRVTRSVIEERIRSLREAVPGLVLRSTVICGFPGETEAEFAELLDFVREGHFQHLGAFPYSREEGTAADAMEEHLPEAVAAERCDAILAAQQEVTFRWLESRIGQHETVLIERQEEGGSVGRTRAEAPEVDGEVRLPGADFSPGERILACLVSRDAYDLIARFE